MRYLCLVYGEENVLAAMANGDMDVLMKDSLDYDETLRKCGHFIVAHALESVRDAVTVQVRNGQRLVTDGPFAETKEQLLGFILIEAQNRTDAIEAAANIPMARVGRIEVRAIKRLVRP
jgi:hypothetical protein